MPNNSINLLKSGASLSSSIKADLEVLSEAIEFDVLGKQQSEDNLEIDPQLQAIIAKLPKSDLSDYIKEAIDCAQHGFYRAAIVMGWCAVIDRLQMKVVSIGYEKFNKAVEKVKNKTKGKYRKWNKAFHIDSLAELQMVFDSDLIVVFEGGLEIFDANEAERLETLFKWRNNSAHPGKAPIDIHHLRVFFNDIIKIVFLNPSLQV